MKWGVCCWVQLDCKNRFLLTCFIHSVFIGLSKVHCTVGNEHAMNACCYMYCIIFHFFSHIRRSTILFLLAKKIYNTLAVTESKQCDNRIDVLTVLNETDLLTLCVLHTRRSYMNEANICPWDVIVSA